MATNSTLLPISDTHFYACQNGPAPVCHHLVSECYAAHYRYVLQVCRRYFRHREDAEDAAAEVFLKLFRVLDQRDETAPFRPWLSQVAGHHCVDKLRRRKSEKSCSLDENDVSGIVDHSTLTPLSQILRTEQQNLVREQLLRLPAKYKVPLVLRYYKRMSYSQIASAMNRGLPAVRMMLFRAKDELRRNLHAMPV